MVKASIAAGSGGIASHSLSSKPNLAIFGDEQVSAPWVWLDHLGTVSTCDACVADKNC